MNKQTVSKAVKEVGIWTTKHKPEILLYLGISGMFTTVALAVKDTPKALRLIEDAEKQRRAPLTKVEVFKVTWKCYIPAAVTGAASTACLISGSSTSTKRIAALTTVYKLSETALTEFKEKALETVGEKKVKEIKEKIIKDKVEQNPVSDSQVILTAKGETLFHESISGRYFKSDIEKIKRAVNELNRRMTYENYISLSDFYDEIGLSRTSISDVLGWNLGKGHIELERHAIIADDETPCITLDYSYAPVYDFDKYW